MELNQEKPLNKFKPFILLGICLLTFLCFIHTLHNQFTNWDDDTYILRNTYIKAFTWNDLKVIFTKNITMNYYHPFTLLSLALNYHFSQMSPMSYYITNILLHVANTALVFTFANLLFTKLEFVNKRGVLFISSLSALWFGIHPMHVESVSWIAERKDVLYTFFYLLGLITYVKYIDQPQTPNGASKSIDVAIQSPFRGLGLKCYVLTLILFIFSCISKPMAVVFPLSLFCIDFLLKRSWSKRIIIEKIPVLLIALIFGLISFHIAQQSNTITSFGNIPLGKRVLFASYGFVMYIAKFFVPFHLSTFYPYPCINMELHVDMPLPLFYYFSFWIALLIVAVPLFITFKTNKNYFRIVVFGLGFFLVNVIFELQFISAGMAIMADRYSYVSYIGLLFMTTFFLNELRNLSGFKNLASVAVTFFTLILGYLCMERTLVWHNAESLFKDAIVQYGDEASLFYKGLGDYYFDNHEPEEALIYYAKYAKLNNDAEVFNDMGDICKSLKDYPNAAKYYTRLLKAGASPALTYVKISDTWAIGAETDSAVTYYKKALGAGYDIEKIYAQIGTASINSRHYENAINHYNVLVSVNPENPYYYFYRGVARFSNDSLKQSIDDFLMPIKLSHNNVVPVAAYNLAVVYDKLGDDKTAYKYEVMARKAGQSIDTVFFNKIERGSKQHPN